MALQGFTINQGKTVLYVILIASVAALGGFLFGYDTAVINGAVSAQPERINRQ